MGRELFVDSSGWYALLDRRDPQHANVQRIVVRTANIGRGLVTSDYIIDETALMRPGAGRTDCTSFELMRELAITSTLTTDAQFVEAGFSAALVRASR